MATTIAAGLIISLAALSCSTDLDCSLNGECHASACRCDDAWRGPRCSTMNLLPPQRLSGLRTVDNGRNTSSWGGSVIYAPEDKQWHMYAAEMVHHCGIDSWMENSRIIHAVSATALGEYTRAGQVFPPFAHEPDVIRDENGNYVLFYTRRMHAPNSTQVPCHCSDGSTPHSTCTGAKYQWDHDPTYYAVATTPWGPWTNQTMILAAQPEVDNNFAAVILANGSLVGFKRRYVTSPEPPAVGNGSRLHLVTATDWRDPATYVARTEELFPAMADMGAEDPFLYMDAKGRFHAVVHNMNPCPQWPCPAVAGGHAFSEDGVQWHYSGVAFNSSGYFDDGTPFSFSRRERPHVIQGSQRELLAVTSGVQYGMANGDATYTFLQPVAAAAAV